MHRFAARTRFPQSLKVRQQGAIFKAFCLTTTASLADPSRPHLDLLLELPKAANNRAAGDARDPGNHADAAVAVSLEKNNRLFNEERERLEKWADDMVLAAEKDLKDTKEQIKALKRQARIATTLDDQNTIQRKTQELERKQRRQRQEIFDLEDQIAEKRDQLIDTLQKRMSQKTKTTGLFTIRREVV